MKKAILSLLFTSTLMMGLSLNAQEIDFSEIIDQNQNGKIEAAMISTIEDKASRLEQLILKKEANFQTNDMTEGKLMAAMVTTVLNDLGDIKAKISTGVSGEEIDTLYARMSELESIVSEF